MFTKSVISSTISNRFFLLFRRFQAYCSSQFSLLPGSQLSVLDALPQLLIESIRCQLPMHEFVYCVASTKIHYAQGSREIFQPEKFLDRIGNRTRRLRIGNSVPLPTRLSDTLSHTKVK